MNQRYRPLVSALALTLVAASPQAPPQPPPSPVVRVTLSLVQVDAVVTDKAGHHVTDLTAADFEISENGRLQEITHSYVSLPKLVALTPTPPASAGIPTPPSPPAPPTRLRPERVRRTLALVVDDLGLSFRSTIEVREALKKFVDQQMEPGDLVAIVRTRGGIGAGALLRLRRLQRPARQGHGSSPPRITDAPLTTGEQRPIDPANGSSTVTSGGAFVLGPEMPPGDYVLQVIVTDGLAGKKNAMVSQAVEFEVRP